MLCLGKKPQKLEEMGPSQALARGEAFPEDYPSLIRKQNNMKPGMSSVQKRSKGRWTRPQEALLEEIRSIIIYGVSMCWTLALHNVLSHFILTETIRGISANWNDGCDRDHEGFPISSSHLLPDAQEDYSSKLPWSQSEPSGQCSPMKCKWKQKEPLSGQGRYQLAWYPRTFFFSFEQTWRTHVKIAEAQDGNYRHP